MTNKLALKALARAKAGKGAARATRRFDHVPAVIYGDNKEPALISLLEKDLVMAAKKRNFFTTLVELDVEGKTHLVMPRDVQLDGVTDRPLHADFLRVTDKTVVRVKVPLTFINHKECSGLNRGGVLNVISHEVEVLCSATKIPESFVIDLAKMDAKGSFSIDDLGIPAGIKAIRPGNFTVVTLVAPAAAKSDAAGAEAEAKAASGKK